uniref:Putative LOV domain-containing protein n=1 Tax=Freycinetia multiflora TaxID=244028 RepID=A0A126WVX1_9LILI|nr:putative LOV domain-containing protein [Freycinetia multiflora]
MVALTLPPPLITVVVQGGKRAAGAMGSRDEARTTGESFIAHYSDWILDALDELPDSFLITDPGLAGHPIVFASRGFLAMSGYAREEVVGRNGRIFQGPATDRRSVMEIREAIREERTIQISLLNYRKDGTPHWILFHLFPVFGEDDGGVVHFVAVQVPIPRRPTGSWCAGARGMAFRGCRDEVRCDAELGYNNLALEPFVDTDKRAVLESEELREASNQDKERAICAANSILSVLTRYSEVTGRRVCGKRCCSAGIAPLSSSLILSLGRIKQSFVLTDPHSHDMPIVYASDAFLSLTGYSRNEVLGRNCRFLSGPETDVGALLKIKESIQAQQACTVRLLNYRKNGSTFWNLLHLSPVRNASGKIAFFVGVQTDEDSQHDGHGLSPEMWQLGAVGAVKVAVRSLSAGVGPSRSLS